MSLSERQDGALRHMSCILSYWKPACVQGVRRPPDDRSQQPITRRYPLAWVATHPDVRQLLESHAAGPKETYVHIAHTSYRQPSLSAAEQQDKWKNYDYQHSDPAKCHFEIIVQALPLSSSGLPLTAWWVLRCERAHAVLFTSAFRVGMTIRSARAKETPTRACSAADFHWNDGSTLLPFHTLCFTSLCFHPLALKSLPVALRGRDPHAVRVVRFSRCTVQFEECLRETSRFAAFDAAEVGAYSPLGVPPRYGWGAVSYLDGSNCSGEAFWNALQNTVIYPQISPPQGELSSGIRALILRHAVVLDKQLLVIMTAVAERNTLVQSKYAETPPLEEVDLSFVKRIKSLSWLGSSPALHSGLRVLALARVDLSADVLIEGLKCYAPAGKRLWLLDVRWNRLCLNDATLRTLMECGISASMIRIGGTAFSSRGAAAFATKVSP